MKQTKEHQANSLLIMVPAMTEGRIYGSSGTTKLYSEIDMVYLMVNINGSEIGAVTSAGDVAYYPKSDVIFI